MGTALYSRLVSPLLAVAVALLVASLLAEGCDDSSDGHELPAPVDATVLPGGALRVTASDGGVFILRSIFTSPGPRVDILGPEANSSASWHVTVDNSSATSGRWTVAAVGDAFSLRRTVHLKGGRVTFNDVLTAAKSHPSMQTLAVGTLLGLRVQHILAFPAGSNATEARVAGALFLSGSGGTPCTNAQNVDEFGVHRGSFGNPTVFASGATGSIGLVPLDDVFETHAHSYQRAVQRLSTQPRVYKGRPFPDCAVTNPPEIEIADPMLAIRAGESYTQEFALYALVGPQLDCLANDYYCFINMLRKDIRIAAGVSATQLLNTTGFMSMPSDHDPITKLGGNEEYQFGLSNWSMPWEDWSLDTLSSFFQFQGFGWVVAGAPWAGKRMNCSYNNGIQTCMGSCVSTELPADAEKFMRTVAQRVNAVGGGRRALMYFHAEISSETNAAEKYPDAIITNPSGEQIFYACDKYYGLFLPNETNSYGQQLMRSIELAFSMGYTGIYHDEAGVTSSAYTYHLWDNHTALLSTTTGAIQATPGSIALLRLKQKLQILEAVVKHAGVLLMNGVPITRTFREAALRAGAGRVMAETEDEQENMMLHTHLFTPVGLTREAGPGYSTDLDFRYNRTCKACLTTASATDDHCMERSVVDKLDYGCLPFLIGRMFHNGTAEPITQRMFPIEIERIGAGFVQGAGKLVTKVSGLWDVGSSQVEVSIYRWGSLLSRHVQPATPGRKVQLILGDGEVAIVEDWPKRH